MKSMARRNLVIHVVFFFVVICLAGLICYVGGQAGKALGPKGFLGIEYNDSLIIIRIIPNSPAEDAGLKAGDRIVSINGVKPVSQDQVVELIAKNRPGSVIEIIVSREGQKMAFKATLVKKPNE